MLIRTKKLTKTFGDQLVIDHLDLEVEEGMLIAYIGTNGAGKSTTMRMLTGLLAPTSGEIELAPDLKIGMVFQESVLDAELTVLDNLRSRLALYRNRDKDWMDKLIRLTRIDAFLNQTYGTLSGGQRRRVDIVRALLNKPNLLFLDEPTTGLDIQTREAIWQLLRQLQAEEKLTIFLTTHYLEEAENADMAYIIDHGNQSLSQNQSTPFVEPKYYSLLQIIADKYNDQMFGFPDVLTMTHNQKMKIGQYLASGYVTSAEVLNMIERIPKDSASPLAYLLKSLENLKQERLYEQKEIAHRNAKAYHELRLQGGNYV